MPQPSRRCRAKWPPCPQPRTSPPTLWPADLAAAEGLIAANASGLTAVNTSLTLGLASKANQSALDALQVQVDGKSTPASVDLKLANHPTIAAMNSSIASTNNATLATVATTYALKTVVDQLAIDVAARQTAADVDQRGGHGAPILPDANGLPGRTGPPGRPPGRARCGDPRPPERRALRHGRGPQQPAGHPAIRHRRDPGGDRHPRRRHQSGQRPRLGRQRDLGPAGRHQPNPQPPRNGPLEHPARQRRLDPELRLRCVHDPADGRRHRRGPHQLLHESRSHRHRGGGHRREQGLHRHPAGRLQHHDSR